MPLVLVTGVGSARALRELYLGLRFTRQLL